MANETMPQKPERFVRFLFDLNPEKDRGPLADLRRGFSKATETRAWPYIARFCDLNDDRLRTAFQTVGAAWATHPLNDDSEYANIGTVLRRIAQQQSGKESDVLSTFEARFRRLLACSSREELCLHLKAVIQAAKAKDIPISYRNLIKDIYFWNDSVKLRWAQQYWGDFSSQMQQGDSIDEQENRGEDET